MKNIATIRRVSQFSYILLLSLWIQPLYSQEYAPGEISIGFTDSVNGIEALNILEELKLQLKSTTFSRHTYWFKTKNDKTFQFKKYLNESRLFDLVDIQLTDTGELSDVIFADAKLGTIKNNVNKLVNSKGDIKIGSIDTHAISIVASVPKGQENTYINKIC